MFKAGIDNNNRRAWARADVLLTHPQTDSVHIEIGHDAACNFPLSVVLTFFQGARWVDEPIEPFTPYAVAHEISGMTTYHHVPLHLFAHWLDEYADERQPL